MLYYEKEHGIKENIHYVIDIKTYASKMQNFDKIETNCELLSDGDEIKCVVASAQDIEYCKNKIESIYEKIKNKKINIIFSPVFGKIELSALASYVSSLKNFMKGSNLTVKLGIQLHKLIWPNIEKGV